MEASVSHVVLVNPDLTRRRACCPACASGAGQPTDRLPHRSTEQLARREQQAALTNWQASTIAFQKIAGALMKLLLTAVAGLLAAQQGAAAVFTYTAWVTLGLGVLLWLLEVPQPMPRDIESKSLPRELKQM